MFNEPLRFSRFAHVFQRDGIAALFHALKLKTVFVEKRLLTLVQEFRYGMAPNQLLESIKNEKARKSLRQLISELANLEILVPIHYDEVSRLKKIQKANLRVSIGILYLLLTDQCNFRCDYCFVENAIPPLYSFSQMTKKTAKAALDLFAKCVARNPQGHQPKGETIIFYGGEPLLNKKVFKFALEYIQLLKEKEGLPPPIKVALNTNGSLIDEEVSELIVKHNVRPSISLDGPQEIQDQFRKGISGRGTFAETIRGYRLLQAKKVPVSISCTIGPHNIERLEEVFQWFVEDLAVQGLGFNLLLNTPQFMADTEYAKRATEKIIRCYEIARKHGIYEDRMMRKVKAFVHGKPHFIDCGGCGRQIVVAPDGQIGLCHAYLGSRKYFVGNVPKDFNPLKHRDFIDWSQRSPINMPQCFDCEALGICGGGCVYNAEIENGSIWTIHKPFCVHTKTILQWLIWDLYAKTQKGGD